MRCKHVFHPVKLECGVNIKTIYYLILITQDHKNSKWELNCFTGQYISSLKHNDNTFDKNNPHISNYAGLLKYQVTLLSVYILG